MKKNHDFQGFMNQKHLRKENDNICPLISVLQEARDLYGNREYRQALKTAESTLPHIDNPRLASEVE